MQDDHTTQEPKGVFRCPGYRCLIGRPDMFLCEVARSPRHVPVKVPNSFYRRYSCRKRVDRNVCLRFIVRLPLRLHPFTRASSLRNNFSCQPLRAEALLRRYRHASLPRPGRNLIEINALRRKQLRRLGDAAIRRASSLVSNLAAGRRPGTRNQLPRMRKPSCLISWSQPGPEGGALAGEGRHGSIIPSPGRVRSRNDMGA
jgi:hypothetical protein